MVDDLSVSDNAEYFNAKETRPKNLTSDVNILYRTLGFELAESDHEADACGNRKGGFQSF